MHVALTIEIQMQSLTKSKADIPMKPCAASYSKRVLSAHQTGFIKRYIPVDECPAYGTSSGGTAGDDTWSGTDDNDAYEEILKHSYK